MQRRKNAGGEVKPPDAKRGRWATSSSVGYLLGLGADTLLVKWALYSVGYLLGLGADTLLLVKATGGGPRSILRF